jgi:hypothetical protein
MKSYFAYIVNNTSACKVVDGRGSVVGGARVAVDLGISINDGDFDPQISRKKDGEQEAGGASARDYDLAQSVGDI